MGERAFGLITILFALPSGLPISIIPGFSFVFGLPIVFIALHLIIGRKSLWLPARLANQTVAIDTLEKVLARTRPYLLHIERLLKPRLLFFLRHCRAYPRALPSFFKFIITAPDSS